MTKRDIGIRMYVVHVIFVATEEAKNLVTTL